jgi:replicative DNA helicase
MSKKLLERDVIVALLADKDKIEAVSDVINSKHFSAPYIKWAYERLLTYHEKYGAIPKVSYFKIELGKNKDLDPDEKSRWYKLIRDIYRKTLDVGASEYAIDELTSFAKRQEVAKIIDRGIDQLDKGDWKEAIETMYTSVDVQIKDSEFEITNWLEEWEERQEERRERKANPEKSKRINLPWPTANAAIGGGIGPGESLTIASLTNVGKSIALVNCGRRSFIDKKKVCHIVIEDTKEMVLQRYDSSILGVKYDDLKHYEFDKKTLAWLEKRIEQVRVLIGENLRVVKTKAKRTSVLTIYKALRKLESEGFIPDVLIIDYADIMIPAKKQEQFRLEQAAVYWDIKSLAEDLGIPIITATQVAKEYLRKKAFVEGLSEAYDKGRILNVVLTLNQLDLSSKDVLLYVAKNRDGEKGQEIPLISNYSNMRLLEKV